MKWWRYSACCCWDWLFVGAILIPHLLLLLANLCTEILWLFELLEMNIVRICFRLRAVFAKLLNFVVAYLFLCVV